MACVICGEKNPLVCDCGAAGKELEYRGARYCEFGRGRCFIGIFQCKQCRRRLSPWGAFKEIPTALVVYKR